MYIIIKPPFLGDTKSVSLSFYRRMNMPESARTRAFPAYRNEVMRILVTEEWWFYFYALLVIEYWNVISEPNASVIVTDKLRETAIV